MELSFSLKLFGLSLVLLLSFMFCSAKLCNISFFSLCNSILMFFNFVFVHVNWVPNKIKSNQIKSSSNTWQISESSNQWKQTNIKNMNSTVSPVLLTQNCVLLVRSPSQRYVESLLGSERSNPRLHSLQLDSLQSLSFELHVSSGLKYMMHN